MEQGVQVTCSTQAVTEPVLGKAGLYGTKGVTEWGGDSPHAHFPILLSTRLALATQCK